MKKSATNELGIHVLLAADEKLWLCPFIKQKRKKLRRGKTMKKFTTFINTSWILESYVSKCLVESENFVLALLNVLHSQKAIHRICCYLCIVDGIKKAT